MNAGQQRALTPITDTPAELAGKCGVSVRTAKRMMLPDYYQSNTAKNYFGETIPGRTVGRDGKSYPHQRRRYQRTAHGSGILAALRYARHGIRRADHIACEHGIEQREKAALAILCATATEILGRWNLAGATL